MLKFLWIGILTSLVIAMTVSSEITIDILAIITVGVLVIPILRQSL